MINSPALTPQKLFPIAALVLGLLYVFITPPFQVPDETNHFYRVIQVAQGELIPDKRGNATGGAVPRSAVVVAEGFTHKIIHNPENKLSKTHFEKAKAEKLNPQDTIFFNFPNSSLYSPVSYLPQVLLVKPALALELPPLWLMYIGRISSVLVSVLLLTWAIRILPAFHWLLFAIALLPMFLYQMASLSGDAFLNSLGVLLVAFAVRATFTEKQLTVKTAIQIAVVALLLAGCKTGYFLLVLLFLLPVFTNIDKVQKRNWILFVAVLFICATGFSAVWSTVVKATFSPYGNDKINPDLAIAFIKTNPLQFVVMLVKNVIVNMPFYLYGIVGYLGWLDVQLPFVITVLYLFTLVIVAYSENAARFEFKPRQHVLLFLIPAAICVFAIASQYLVTTPAGSDYIERSQGRYFLPVLLPLLLMLRVKRFSFISAQRIENNLGKIVPTVSLVSSFVAFYAILNRFYF